MPHVPGHEETAQQRALRIALERLGTPTSRPPAAVTTPTPPRPPTPAPPAPAPTERPEIEAFNAEQRRTLALQKLFASTSLDVVGQRVLDPLGRAQRTGSGVLLQAAARTPLVGRIPGLSEFQENVEARRAAGAGRLESLRLAREQAEQQTEQFPSTSIPLSRIPLPFGREIPDIPIGVLGGADLLADPTILAPGIGFGTPLARSVLPSIRAGLRGAARAPGAIAREVSTTPRLRGQLTAPVREAARPSPAAVTRAVGEGQILPGPAVSAVPEQQALPGIGGADATTAPPTLPRGPDVPAGGAQPVLPELPAIERIIAEDFQQNAAARIGQRAARIPGVRASLGEQINPSLLADTDIDRAVIAYGGLLDSGDTAAKGAVAQLRELGPVWQVDEATGRVLNVRVPSGASDDILDVLTFPEQYGLSPGQTEWVRRFKVLRDERLGRLAAKNIELDELTDFREAAEAIGFDIDVGAQGQFFPRVTTGERVSGPAVPRLVGARQAQQKQRKFASAQQGRADGLQYISDPNQAAEILLRGAYKLEADDDLVKFIGRQPEVRQLAPGQQARRGERLVAGQPAFSRFAMPEAQANRLGATLNATGNTMLQKAGDLNAMSIFLQTGIDPGFLLIQGAIPLFRNPVAWGRTTKVAFEALTSNGLARQKYLAANMATIQKMVSTRSVPFASSDLAEAGTTGLLSRIPGAKRAADAFNTWLDVGRIELQKAADSRAITPADQRAMTNVIDHMVGLSSPRGLGVSPTRRQFERAIVFYASRYRRAAMSLFIDASQGGIRGQEARRGLASFLLGGFAIMSAAAVALGQKERVTSGQMFNPTRAKFMGVRVRGTEIGIGTAVVSLIRMGGNVFAGAQRDGLVGAKEAALKSLKGQAAPLTGIATDLASGENYFGEPVYDKQGLLTMAAERTLPFYIEPYITEGLLDPLAPVPGPERGIAASIGTRERAVSPYDQRRDERDEQVAKAGLRTLDGQPAQIWADLNQSQQKDLARRSPELRKRNELIDALNLRRASDAKKSRLTIERETRQEFDQRMVQMATQLQSRVMSKKQYDDARTTARTLRRGQRDAIWRQRAILEADDVEGLEKWIADNQRPEDAALSVFYERQAQLINEVVAQEPLSSPVWKRIQATLRAEMLRTYGNAITQYIFTHKDDWILDLPDISRQVEQRRTREIESGAWWENYSPRTTTPTRFPTPLREGLRGGVGR